MPAFAPGTAKIRDLVGAHQVADFVARQYGVETIKLPVSPGSISYSIFTPWRSWG